ncbi:hypothetical protein VTO42DRAFT_4714 [Malbranchea cinnamomea]
MASGAPVIENLASSLRARLTGSEVLTQSSPGYDDAIKRWSDAAVKRAGLILLATNATDISQAVLFAQENRLDLAVRGGGHSVAGTSSSDGGLVIDLSRMRKVTVDKEKKTITAQGGALWADVDTAAAEHALATVGGTVNHTGIGGLTLGGGYGWLSPKYGLTIDNLLSVTIVLADGRIVTASETENPDLFWAVRGAGHNFGVAVDFTYQGYDQPNEVFCGMLAFTPDKLEAIIEVLNSHLQNPDVNSGSVCVFAPTPSSPTPLVIPIIFYNGTEEVARKRFAGLYALGPVVDETGMAPYVKVNSLMNQSAVHGGRRSFKGVFFSPPLRPAFARQVFESFSEKIQSEPEMAGSALILEFFDMKKICERSLTDTAFANRGESRNGVLTTRWESPEKDGAMRAWAREVQMMFKKEMDTHGSKRTDSVPQYINYAEPGDSVVPNIYGVNTERLQHLKWKYDPNNVFGKMNPIKPVQP